MDFLTIHYAASISIVLRVISCVELLVFCIPLQIKEAKVQNGLRGLRYQLLGFGIILFLTNAFSLALLFQTLANEPRLPNALLQVGNAIAFLVLSTIGYRMYHTQYTDEIKDAHIELQKIETRHAEEKKAEKEAAKIESITEIKTTKSVTP